jgi:hypothetical protein
VCHYSSSTSSSCQIALSLSLSLFCVHHRCIPARFVFVFIFSVLRTWNRLIDRGISGEVRKWWLGLLSSAVVANRPQPLLLLLWYHSLPISYATAELLRTVALIDKLSGMQTAKHEPDLPFSTLYCMSCLYCKRRSFNDHR